MIALLLGTLGFAAPVDDVRRALDRNDVPAAQAALAALPEAGAENLALRAEVLFYAGEYGPAYDTLSAAVGQGYADEWGDLALYERTMYATSGWVEESRGRFAVRYRPGPDAVIVPDALDTLEAAQRSLENLVGAAPPGRTLLELYPDGRSFIAASSLDREDVYTTGVVALSKWSRLLVASPRAQSRGYDWRDTVAHEYIHLVVAHHSNNRAPVWLQEAIARYLDNRWVDGKDAFALDARSKGLLAEALAADDLVSFEEMHPSLAKLPTADRAALAYAQLSTLMAWCFREGGEGVLLRMLPEVGKGVDPRLALARAVGHPDFDSVVAAWRAWITTQDLEGRVVAALPTVLDGGEETELDPLLANNADLARFVRVGARLFDAAATLGDPEEQRRFREAAIVEYEKAIPVGEPASPVLALRLAEARVALGQSDLARDVLERSAADWPEFAATHAALGRIHRAAGREAQALAAWRAAADLYPYDLEVLEGIAAVAPRLGDTDAAARAERALALRREGGGGFDLPPLHERSGTYELPSSSDREAGAALPDLVGEPAPSFALEAIDGRAVGWPAFEGRVVVVDFWATWCGPCRASMPELDRLARENPEIRVVGLSDEPAAKVKAFAERSPVGYPLVAGVKGAKLGYAVDVLPTLYVVGRDGRIVDVVRGADLRRIERAIAQASGE